MLGTAVSLISGLELEPRKSDSSPHLYSSNSLITSAISLTEGQKIGTSDATLTIRKPLEMPTPSA